METYIYAFGITVIALALVFIAFGKYRNNLHYYDAKTSKQINKSQAPLWRY